MSAGTPPPEIVIDVALVRALLESQHPDLGDLPLKHVESGWDNDMFRLGDDLAVRLPRRAQAAPLIESEQIWLPRIADNITLPAPIPLRKGAAMGRYPWAWSVVPWLAGETADLSPPAADQAPIFAEFLKALHQPAPLDAPRKPSRGVPLVDLKDIAEERLGQLSNDTPAIPDIIPDIWSQALAAPAASKRRWLHGDLHARNVLVQSGKISGIVDWGDMTNGDVATDLGSVWGLFADKAARKTVLNDYGATDSQISRARGWATLIGAVLLLTGRVDNPRHAEMGRLTLERLAEDA
ncbi:MAG: aminoglycoside phosphotransferase family protein [Alphaproteobacteria bacterium]